MTNNLSKSDKQKSWRRRNKQLKEVVYTGRKQKVVNEGESRDYQACS